MSVFKMFIYCSTRKSDKCSYVMVFTNTESRAFSMVKANFKKHNYKGKPKLIAV